MKRKNEIFIKVLGKFSLVVNDTRVEDILKKSKKGSSLVWCLLLHRGEKVFNNNILDMLWINDGSANPESALKTLVSRTRALLNNLYPDLGSCIVSERGGYRWRCLDNMTVDLYELQDVFAAIDAIPRDSKKAEDKKKRVLLYNRVLELYKGDLLDTEEQDWSLSKAIAIHNEYLEKVYDCVEFNLQAVNYDEIIRVCRTALEVDAFDEKLHLELMNALTKSNRNNEAMLQYKHVTKLHYRYLGVPPTQAIQDFYKQITQASQTLEFNLDSIRKELMESSKVSGAFECEYTVFKEIFNLQMRNIKRLGSTMFLGLVMITDINNQPLEPLKQNDIMQGTLDIMKNNLRKGDTITQFSPTLFAMLLPTVNYTTGNMVIERLKKQFYRKYPNSNVLFHAHIGPLYNENPDEV
ncbi:MAG: BTAD domain-containing putative transcriptional regulator [Clostridia bacterium]|nr:BTAD domain-containing putative transcriptional regulator [Clostridia bacterium]